MPLLTRWVGGTEFKGLPKLKIVANCAAGHDNVDLVAAELHGVVVTDTPDIVTEATADLTWALILATTRRLLEGVELVRSGRWTGWHPEQLPVLERGRAHRISDLTEHVRSGVADLVDAVAKTHDAPAGGQLIPYPALGATSGLDVLEHVEHRTRRAAVQRTLEGADRARHGADYVRARARDHASGERRRVHAVVDHGHPVRVDRTGGDRIGLLAVDHIEEIRGER